MNLEYLKSFYWIAKCNSISKASQKLHMSQPGLSNQLKRLEDELGYPLLSRSNQGVLLTSAGEIVFDYSKSIFKLEENMHETIGDLNKSKNKLSIAACKNFGFTYFASKIHDFKELYSQSDIKIDTYNSSEVIDKILNYDYNIGIISGQANLDGLEEVDFFDDKLILFTKYNYPKDSINIKDLAKHPIILRENTSNTYSMLNSFLKHNGLNIENFNILYSSNCIEIIRASVLNGCGFSFLPKGCIDFELKNKYLKEIKINNCDMNSLLNYRYSLIKRKKYKLNLYERKIREFLFS